VGRASALSVPGSEIEPAEQPAPDDASTADAAADNDAVEKKML
jgi:hypothetical protein